MNAPNKKQQVQVNELFVPRWAVGLAQKWANTGTEKGVECAVSEGRHENFSQLEDVVKVEFKGKFASHAADCSMRVLLMLLRMQINAVRHTTSFKGLEFETKTSGVLAQKVTLSHVNWSKEGDVFKTVQLAHIPALGMQSRPEGWDEDLMSFLTPLLEKPTEPSLIELRQKFSHWTMWRDGHGSNLCQWVWAHCGRRDENSLLDWLKEHEASGGDAKFTNPSGRHMGLTLAALRGDSWEEVKTCLDWLEERGLEWWGGSKQGVRVESILMGRMALMSKVMGGAWQSELELAQGWFAGKERARLMKKVESGDVKKEGPTAL